MYKKKFFLYSDKGISGKKATENSDIIFDCTSGKTQIMKITKLKSTQVIKKKFYLKSHPQGLANICVPYTLIKIEFLMKLI